MKRQVIQIDEELCNGCGICVEACHEGALELKNGVAVLMREDFCDGMGDCLPECPQGAITFVERDVPAYNEAAVLAAKTAKAESAVSNQHAHDAGCPGSRPQFFARSATAAHAHVAQKSELAQWPCQIKLMPISAPYYAGADLLIAADCTAYAYANVHAEYMAGKITLIGCPKLDAIDYSEKLGAIFGSNSIQSITLLRMEVPCCGGLEMAIRRAIDACGKDIPFTVHTFSTRGELL